MSHKQIEKRTVHGSTVCLCGCGRTVQKPKIGNAKIKMFYSDGCRMRFHSGARDLGHEILTTAPDMQTARRAALLPSRIRRVEMIDLESMSQAERLRELCRAAARLGVMPAGGCQKVQDGRKLSAREHTRES